jgi:type I restriction enzyme S subunit
MEVMSGFKQTEVGVIPEDWKVGSATDVCELVVDCKNRTPPVVASSDFAVVRTPNVRNGQFVIDELRYTNEESYRLWTERAVPQIGDILITREAPLGEVCAVPPNYKVCLGQRMMLYRPDPEKAFSTYLLFSLMSEPVRKNLFKTIGGSTVGHAKVDDIRFLQIPVPPLPEQQAIATALSDTDAFLDLLDRLIAKKRDLKQAAMQQLLSGQTRLPGFSGEWEVKRLGEIAFVSKGTQLKSELLQEGGLFPHLNGGTTPSGYTNKFNTNGNTIAISEGGNSCGFVQFMSQPYWCGGHCYSVIQNGVDNQFLYQALKGQQSAIMGLRVGSGLPNIQKTGLLNFKIRFPVSTAEQTAIAEVLTGMDEDLMAVEKRRNKTAVLKQGMMQELLTGRTRLV